ncbi:MAG TPA: hypothetical protein VHD62_06925 [Opitutaceae bacterium]|nr:hypothetical protein [Opitutaceae bacterium]
MKIFPLHLPLAAVVAAALFFTAGRAEEKSPAASEPSGPTQLVIAHGVIQGRTTDGRPTRATLRNLADELMRLYPTAVINIAGVDDVVVGDVILHVPHVGFDRVDGTVHAILDTLVEATDEPKFAVKRFGERTYVLSRTRVTSAAPARNIEVFNLKLYLEGPGETAELELQRREAETHLDDLGKNLKKTTARFAAGLQPTDESDQIQSEIELQKNRIDLLKQKLERKHLSKEMVSARIDALVQVARSTLEKLNPGEKPPEFEYHAGTYLLIVIGSDTAIDVTRKVVNALQQSPN